MKWEYVTLKMKTISSHFAGGMVDTNKLERKMNDMGRDGWELATTFTTNIGAGTTNDVFAIFKRPLE